MSGTGLRPDPAARTSAARHAALIVLVAVAVRVALPLAAPGLVRDSWDTTHRYAAMAHGLLDGQGFAVDGVPSAASGPVYPLLLAAVFATLGEGPWAIRAVLSLLDVATCLLAWSLARRLAGPRPALLAGLALAAGPYLPYPILLAASDTLFVTLITAALLLLVRTHDGAPPWTAAASGLLLGLAAQTRATALLLPAALALGMLLALRPRRRGAAAAALLLAACALTLAPWTVRNAVRFGRFVPVQTLGGYHLLLAAAPEEAEQASRRTRGEPAPPPTTERDSAQYRAAVARIAEDPGRFVERMGRRLVTMWFLTHSGRWSALLAAANGTLLLLAAAGALALRRRWRLLTPLLITLAYFVAVHTVFFAIFRYMLPVVPILAMLAAVPAAALLAPRSRREAGTLPVAAGDGPSIAVVVPAGPGSAADLERCLAAIAAARPAPQELLVVADGADPAVIAAATAAGARVEHTPRALGPAAARNLAVHAAGAEVILFLDADVVAPPDLVGRVAALMAAGDVDALFGSYDDAPADRHLVSTYRNLLHHWVHQNAREEASTFWSGCGAVRRAAFLGAGGFRVHYRRPSIEDIELGLRLRAHGYRIRLVKQLQVRHLKAWRLVEMVRTDVLGRAAPWAELLLERRAWIDDLNLRRSSRVAVLAAAAVAVGVALVPLAPAPGAALAAAAAAVFVGLEGSFLAFLVRRLGPLRALAAVPLHLLHNLSAGLGFAIGLTRHLRRRLGAVVAAPAQEPP